MTYRVTFSDGGAWTHAIEVQAEDVVEAASEAWNKVADDGYDPSTATTLAIELVAEGLAGAGDPAGLSHDAPPMGGEED